MTSTKQKARIAGWWYLLLVFTGVFNLLYVPNKLVVFGDAAATASNILASEMLFRSGIFVGLVSQIVFVMLALALFRLFRNINERLAVLMVTLVVISATLGFITTLGELATLVFLSGADFLSVFDQPQLEAFAYMCLRMHSLAIQGIQIFWGLWLFPFGLLVIHSRFIPKVFGFLLIIAGVGYVLSSFVSVVLPQAIESVSTLVNILEMGELPIVFWLLIMGARPQNDAA